MNNKLSKGEKQLLKGFLDDMQDQMEHAGCNDTSEAMYKCLTDAEWAKVHKKVYNKKGSFEDLCDIDIFMYIRMKLKV